MPFPVISFNKKYSIVISLAKYPLINPNINQIINLKDKRPY
jgi:hypothetical protein